MTVLNIRHLAIFCALLGGLAAQPSFAQGLKLDQLNAASPLGSSDLFVIEQGTTPPARKSTLGAINNYLHLAANSIDATLSSGADMCAKISAAATTLAVTYPGGGTIDARGFTGTQNCAGNMFATWPSPPFYSTVLLGSANIITNVGQVIPTRTALIGASPYNDAMTGENPSGASIQVSDSFPNSTAVLSFGVDNSTFAIHVANIGIVCLPPGGGANPSGSIGILNRFSQESTYVNEINIRGCHTGFQIDGYAANGQHYHHLNINDTGLVGASDYHCFKIGSTALSFDAQEFIGDVAYVSCGNNAATPATDMLVLDGANYTIRHVYLECQSSGGGCTRGANIGGQSLPSFGARLITIDDLYCGGTSGIASGGDCVKISTAFGPVTLTNINAGSPGSNTLNDTLTGGCVIPGAQETTVGLYARGYSNRIINNSGYCPKP